MERESWQAAVRLGQYTTKRAQFVNWRIVAFLLKNNLWKPVRIEEIAAFSLGVSQTGA